MFLRRSPDMPQGVCASSSAATGKALAGWSQPPSQTTRCSLKIPSPAVLWSSMFGGCQCNSPASHARLIGRSQSWCVAGCRFAQDLKLHHCRLSSRDDLLVPPLRVLPRKRLALFSCRGGQPGLFSNGPRHKFCFLNELAAGPPHTPPPPFWTY